MPDLSMVEVSLQTTRIPPSSVGLIPMLGLLLSEWRAGPFRGGGIGVDMEGGEAKTADVLTVGSKKVQRGEKAGRGST